MDKIKRYVTQALPYILLIGGSIGLAASIILTLDKIAILKDPAFTPSCSINPLLSCKSVINSPQAQVFFGIPNPVFGISGFSVVMAVGVALLAGGQFKRWFWRAFNLGLLAAIIFIHWLISQSVYVIGALCIYCMVVWAMTAALFWYTTLYNIQHGYLSFGDRFKPVTNFMTRYHDVLLFSWYALIVFLILQHFWSYFSFLV